LEIQQKLKNKKHREGKLQEMLAEGNSKDAFLAKNKKWRQRRRSTTRTNVYDSEASEFMCIIFYFACQTSSKWGRAENLCKTIKGSKAKGKQKKMKKRRTFKLLVGNFVYKIQGF